MLPGRQAFARDRGLLLQQFLTGRALIESGQLMQFIDGEIARIDRGDGIGQFAQMLFGALIEHRAHRVVLLFDLRAALHNRRFQILKQNRQYRLELIGGL